MLICCFVAKSSASGESSVDLETVNAGILSNSPALQQTKCSLSRKVTEKPPQPLEQPSDIG